MVLEKGLLIPWFMGEYDITHPTHHLGHVARTILWSRNVKDTFRGKLDVFRQGVFGTAGAVLSQRLPLHQ